MNKGSENTDREAGLGVEARVPQRPESRTPRRRVIRRPGVRARTIVVIAALVLTVIGVSMAALDFRDARRGRAVAGSRVGHQDPFEVRRPHYLTNVWAHDFVADPTELLVDGKDAFIVTPHEVTALGTDDGHQRWRVDVKDAEPFIAVDRDTVLVAAVDGFEALERSTGASRWRVGVADPTDRGRTVGVGHAGATEIAFAATEHGVLIGFDGATGAVRWSIKVEGSPHGRLAVDDATGSVALETTDGERVTLRMLDAGSGDVRWSVALDRDTGVPAFVGDLLVVGTGREVSGAIRAYAVSDGSRRWQTPATDGFEETMAPARVGTSTVFVDKLGMAMSVAIRTGKIQWSTKLPGPVLAGSPVVAGGIVVIHDLFAQVHTLDLRTGRLLASRQSIGVPIGLGGAANRIVYAQSQVQHGQVMAYAPELLASRVGRR